MTLSEKAFCVSWDQFHRDARALSWRLAEIQKDWQAIVAVTRGGLVPAAVICRELGIRTVETLCVASYHEYDKQTDLAILKNVCPDLRQTGGENIIVIDDLTDTGKTFAAVKEILPKAHFATIYSKPQGKPLVDTYITEVSQDTWIYFPWDMGFTYQAPINKNHNE